MFGFLCFPDPNLPDIDIKPMFLIIVLDMFIAVQVPLIDILSIFELLLLDLDSFAYILPNVFKLFMIGLGLFYGLWVIRVLDDSWHAMIAHPTKPRHNYQPIIPKSYSSSPLRPT